MARAVHAAHAAGLAAPHHADPDQMLPAAAASAHAGCEGDEAGADGPMPAHMGGLCCPLACTGLAARPALVAAPSHAPSAPIRLEPSGTATMRNPEPPTPPPRDA